MHRIRFELWVVPAVCLTTVLRPAAAAEGDRLHAVLGGSADFDGDGDVDLDDYRAWPGCMDGPGVSPSGMNCLLFDLDDDQDVDSRDYRDFQISFSPPAPPAGNACAQAVPISGEDQFVFSNSAATRDGLDHAACAAYGTGQIDRDVWMCWQSPCTELVVVETCGLSTIDTKIAVYNSCICPATDDRLLACNDDSVCGVQSRATFSAMTGLRYLIRVGSRPDTGGGSGQVRIRCGFDACPGEGNCFEEQATPGCGGLDCCNTTCAVDPLCCDSAWMWDGFCVAEAQGLCGEGFSECGSILSGPCTTANTTGGCQDEECCDAVCRVNPGCCLDTWDLECVERLEAAICFSTCGPGAGSCLETHGPPGCEDQGCCAEVCPRDPFCCHMEWDEHCVDLAAQHCN